MARTSVVVLLMALAFMACGWDWTVVPKAASPDAGDGTCATNVECRADEYCAFEDGLCGAGSRGICLFTPLEADCSDPDLSIKFAPDQTCGCDGKTAKGECAVRKTRTSLSHEAGCPVPPDTFRCGPFFCPRSTTYCFEDHGPKGTAFFCVEWPCAEHTCAACPDTKAKCPSASCSTNADLDTTVVCTEAGK